MYSGSFIEFSRSVSIQHLRTRNNNIFSKRTVTT